MKFLNCYILALLALMSLSSSGQISPSSYENIDYLITFGKQANSKWGDDDNVQIHFFVIPKEETAPVYIRVFDPETSGACDTKNASFNTKTTFSIYGGKGSYSNKACRNVNPVKGYDQGVLIKQKTFGNSTEYDKKWYAFGPLNPSEGEYSKKFNGYIFKMICKGESGDDGNAYKYSLSYSKDENLPIHNGNIFTYELSFHLKDKKISTAHVYPFIDDNIVSFTQYNFDADKDLRMRFTSVARKLIPLSTSGDGLWSSNTFKILKKEINTSLDIQLVKQSNAGNDMVVYILNQYREAIPLFSVPIGGKPKCKYNVKVKTSF